MDESGYLYGLDLGWDITQASRFSRKSGEPESVSFSGGQQELLMPAVLCRKSDGGEWFYGQEAIRLAARGAGELVSGLLERLVSGRSFAVGDEEYTADFLMEQYLRKLLFFFRQCYGTSEITRLAVTLPRQAQKAQQALEEIFSRIGVEKEKIRFLSHTECFMYYCINMPPELWQNDVALFDCDDEHFYFERLSSAKKKQPPVMLVREQDFSEEYREHIARGETDDRKAYWFYTLAQQQFHSQPVTSVYVTGSGFSGGWADDVLRKLCEGRRVFFGQNLYTKGACYAAKMAADGSDEGCVLLSGDMIQASIYVKLYRNSEEDYVELARAGTDYREAGRKLRIVLDDTQEIDFFVHNVLKREPVHEVMILENLMKRENKTVMLELSLQFADRETPIVQVRDLGFGKEACSHRIWEQTLQARGM